ncbi:hypothetical protein NIES2101_36280 [Calothrix sp. HK-06]|nr:hypothetical protein NIES2101_36280 [Calothrix sp. HK-06]
MEYLAYCSMFDANETAEPELGLPEIQFNFQKLFNQNVFKSTSLALASLGLVFATFGEAQAATRGYVRTSGNCLRARTQPSVYSGVTGCLPNGLRVSVARYAGNGFSQLSSGYYVASRFVTLSPRRGNSSGLGVGGPIILSPGSTGITVSQVQRSLGVSQTGYYGPVTERAVRNFQINNGLLVDGKVGPQTRIALGV